MSDRCGCALPTPQRRLGSSILLSLLSLLFAGFLLFNRANLSPHLPKSSEAAGLGRYSGVLNGDGGDELQVGNDDTADGIRVVVLGDSWVADTPQSDRSGKGKSWARIVCDKVLLYLYYMSTLSLCMMLRLQRSSRFANCY